MKNLKVFTAMATLSIILFSSCKKNDPANNPDGTLTQFGVKQGTIVYNSQDGTETVFFDNYGKQFRLETKYAGDDGIYILDEIAQKAYYLYVATKTYQEMPLVDVQGLRGIITFEETEYILAGMKKSTQTIAGKSCTVYTGTYRDVTAGIGGWNGIIFLLTDNGGDTLRATSFSETIPANMFTLPSGYTKQQ